METCKHCSEEVSEIEEYCPTCGSYAGHLNVRAAEKDNEVEALESRYLTALEEAKADGREQALMSFDESMRKTCAVVNLDLNDLYQFITGDKAIYSNYSLSVKGQTRRPATPKADSDRRTIEAMLFGVYAEKIRYAALSLDGAGLKSYGPYALKFREISITDRATLLEDNSYTFISKHNIAPLKEIPPGYRATWRERHKLAVAKLSWQISASTTEANHSKILLSDTGNRKTDEFIEVHIYGSFSNKAIESVRGVSPTTDKNKMALISTIKDYLKAANQTWIEE